MRLKDYNKKQGKRVWLSRPELEDFIRQAQNPSMRIAFLLGGRSGLRRSEITSVTPNDFKQAPEGYLRVWEDYAKRDKYRETTIPDELNHIVETLSFDRDPAKPIVDVEDTTVYRWVKRAGERMYANTEDPGWTFLDVHDLRRTWGTDLLEQGVIPSVVMWWGGWEDWETFREHYLGEFSPEALDRERGKVDYLGGEFIKHERKEVEIASGTHWSKFD